MKLLTTHFKTALDNMNFDNELVQKVQTNALPYFFRLYSWQQPGITQTEKRPLDKNLTFIDHAPRLTGGGIVFHCPGDLVFSHAAKITDPRLPKSIKKRCEWLSNAFHQAFTSVNIPVKKSIESQKQNIQFCSSYHNPYELTLNNHKVLGIAVKKTKDIIAFQVVIHLHPTKKWFNELSKNYEPFFTPGILTLHKTTTIAIINTIHKQLSVSFA